MHVHFDVPYIAFVTWAKSFLTGYRQITFILWSCGFPWPYWVSLYLYVIMKMIPDNHLLGAIVFLRKWPTVSRYLQRYLHSLFAAFFRSPVAKENARGGSLSLQTFLVRKYMLILGFQTRKTCVHVWSAFVQLFIMSNQDRMSQDFKYFYQWHFILAS